MAPPTQLSEEFVQDSSDEDSNGRTDDVLATNTIPNSKTKSKGKKDTNDDSGSSSASSSSDEESDEGSEENDKSPSPSRKRPREQTPSTPKTAPKRQKSTRRIPAKPLRIPEGFEQFSRSDSTDETRILDALGDLDDKQVWHISAPASLDLSKIEELDIAAVLAGGPVLTSGGISYRMQAASEQTEVLLLPQQDPVVYRPSKTKVSRSLQLRQIAKVPKPPTPSEKASTNGSEIPIQAQRVKRTVRQQPVGKLNYQHFPFGVDKPSPPRAQEDVDMAEAILLKAVQASPENEKKKSKKSKLTNGPSP